MMQTMDWLNEQESTGTTIVAAEFDGGVIIGADSRTTTGAFVANRVSDKLTKLTDNIYCCRSGSAADTQAIADIAAHWLGISELETGEPALVKSAAVVVKDICYNYRDQMSAGIIIGGYDSRLGGQVYAIPIGGMLVRQSIALGGSGSTYIYGYVDSAFKEGMSKDECIEFVKKCIALAIARDGSSGGVMRLGVITKEGVQRLVFTPTMPEFPRFYEG